MEVGRTSSFVPLSITTTTSLPSGGLISHYAHNLSAQAGIPFYNWTVVSGALPDGLQFDGLSGVVSGIPMRAGRFTFTLRLQEYSEGSVGVTKKMTIVVSR
jgi:hypothetical protein